MQPDEIEFWRCRRALFAKKQKKDFSLTLLKAPNNIWLTIHNPSTINRAHKHPSFDIIPMYIIIYSVCHYIFYYTGGNWIVFSCLYSNQEIRLTDVPPILMATSSLHFFLTILPQLHLFSLSLSFSLSLPTPFLSFFLPCLMCSPQQRRQFPYRITTRIRWPGFDSPSKPCMENENVFMCVGSSTSNRREQFLPPENVVRLQCVIVDKPTGYILWKI